MTYFR